VHLSVADIDVISGYLASAVAIADDDGANLAGRLVDTDLIDDAELRAS
jgi:hypothetical protein